MMPRPTCLLAGLLALCWGMGAAAQVQRQEYHVRQEADEGVLIRIDGIEADYRAVLSLYDGETAIVSAMPGERLAPRFQYLPPTRSARDLVLEILPVNGTNRSRFDIGLSRLAVRDDRSARLGQAYRALSQAQQEDASASSAAWASRVYGLDEAAAIFESMGMEELRGWARYCAAWFVLHGLGDIQTALDRARSLLADLPGGRSAPTQLAAQRLVAESLSQPAAAAGPEAAEAAWVSVAGEAERQSAFYEQAYALSQAGRTLALRGKDEAAAERYQAALEIADRIGAGDLGTTVREALLPIFGQQGDASATGEVLGEIESQLAESGDTDELARNLLAQGRLANRTFRPQRALLPLQQALDLQRNSLIRSQAQLELARALFTLGRLEEAQAQAMAAVTDPATQAFRRAIPALDVRDGIDLLAATYRAQGDFESLDRVREAQARWLGADGQDAAWWFQRGLDGDARSTGGGGRHYARAAATGAGGPWVALGRLHACGLGALSGEACASSRLQSDLEAWRDSAVPGLAMEARLAGSRWQRRSGNAPGADTGMSALAERSLFYREALPGVLDAWLVQRAPVLESDYLAPLLRGEDGFTSLLALARLRRLAGTASLAGDQADDNFRAQLAQAAEAANAPGKGAIRQRLDALYTDYTRRHPEHSASGLRAWLATLEGDQALLTWHVGHIAAAWVARNGSVLQVRLDDAAGLARLLARGREQLAVLDGDAFDALAALLGERLLAPLSGQWPQRLLVAPAGPVLGLPIDALRSSGRYLVERSEVTQLLTFPGGEARLVPALGGVFVAGAPTDYSPEVPLGLDLPAGLRTVMNAFVGPGLYVVQGGALLPDEFDTPQYAQARIVHLENPAQIDLSRPQRSALELSEAMRGEGRSRLQAPDIAARPLAAALVWLGQSRITGEAMLASSTRLPLVGEWLDAGAGQVVATAWPVADARSAELLRVFYAGLDEGQDVATALRRARLDTLKAGDDPSRDWAAPLLFTH